MGMRGEDASAASLFSYVSCEARVAVDHPLRAIRRSVDEALECCRRPLPSCIRRPGGVGRCARIEETFGWTKSTAGLRATHHRGLARVA
jgi:hypothetical protein